MSLTRRAISSTFWVAGGTYINALLNFVTMVWLMRLLAPELFGTIALAMFFMGMAKKLFAFGFNHSLIHKQDDLEHAVPTHLFLHLSASALTLVIVLAASPILLVRYGTEMVTALIALTAFALFEDGSHTPRILLEKSLLFGKVSILNSSSVFLSAIVSITLAYMGFGIWALVSRYAVMVVLGFIGYWILSPVRFRIRVDRKMITWFLKFGGYLWIGGMATYLVLELDDFLVGTMVGAVALGFYNRAYRFSCLPTDIIGSVIARVAFPLYAQLQSDRERLSQTVRLVLRAVFVLSLPASVWLVIVARPFTELLLGDRWIPMVPLLQLLVLYSALRPLSGTTGELLVAVGRPRSMGRIILMQAAVLTILCPPLTYFYQAAGAAVSVGLVMMLGVAVSLIIVRRHVDVTYNTIFTSPLVSTVAGTFVALGGAYFLETGSQWQSLLIRSVLFVAGFLLVLIPLQGRTLIEDARYLVKRFRN